MTATFPDSFWAMPPIASSLLLTANSPLRNSDYDSAVGLSNWGAKRSWTGYRLGQQLDESQENE
jgi:hypothetical protein